MFFWMIWKDFSSNFVAKFDYSLCTTRALVEIWAASARVFGSPQVEEEESTLFLTNCLKRNPEYRWVAFPSQASCEGRGWGTERKKDSRPTLLALKLVAITMWNLKVELFSFSEQLQKGITLLCSLNFFRKNGKCSNVLTKYGQDFDQFLIENILMSKEL